jgi:hypothetical protein
MCEQQSLPNLGRVHIIRQPGHETHTATGS